MAPQLCLWPLPTRACPLPNPTPHCACTASSSRVRFSIYSISYRASQPASRWGAGADSHPQKPLLMAESVPETSAPRFLLQRQLRYWEVKLWSQPLSTCFCRECQRVWCSSTHFHFKRRHGSSARFSGSCGRARSAERSSDGEVRKGSWWRVWAENGGSSSLQTRGGVLGPHGHVPPSSPVPLPLLPFSSVTSPWPVRTEARRHLCHRLASSQ